MHIAMVMSTPMPPEEGIGYYTRNLSESLVERGHTVTIFTRGTLLGGHDTISNLELVKVPFIPSYPFHVDVHRIPMERALLKYDPDVVHLHSPLTPSIQLDVPTVLTIHSTTVGDANSLSDINLRTIANKLVTRVSSRRIINAQCESSNVITSVSKSTAEEVSRYFEQSSEVIGNGVDAQQFSPLDNDQKNSNTLLFVGRLDYPKAVEILIEALQFLDSNINCNIVGSGPREAELKLQAEQLGVSDSISFRGHLDQEELIHYYRSADVFVFPSYHEGLPTVLLEAMACGLPCVTTDVSGCRDVVEHNQTGYLCKPDDVEQFAQYVQSLLSDAERRNEFGEVARQRVLENYTWSHVTDRIEGIYQEVV